MNWAIGLFETYKTTDPYGIFPKLLEAGTDIIIGPLIQILEPFMPLDVSQEHEWLDEFQEHESRWRSYQNKAK